MVVRSPLPTLRAFADGAAPQTCPRRQARSPERAEHGPELFRWRPSRSQDRGSKLQAGALTIIFAPSRLTLSRTEPGTHWEGILPPKKHLLSTRGPAQSHADKLTADSVLRVLTE